MPPKGIKIGSKSKSGGYDDGSDNSAVVELYESLADSEDSEIISMDGIGRLCEQLGIDPESDVRLLVLLWRLGANSKPGCITREEFMQGMRKIGKEDIKGIISLLPVLDPGFLERAEFRDFYKFVFQFSREGTHKTIEKDLIVALLPVVVDRNRAPHLEHFLQFLSTSNHQRITLDQWESFLQFNHNVKLDLSNYDADGAWPLLLDEYVDWRRKQ